MYEQSHRDYSAPVICIIVCPSWAVNHYRDNAITYKARATKMPENWLANAAITDMQMRHACCQLDAKYTKGVSWPLKLKMMLCVMMLPLVVGCIIKSSLSVSAGSCITASGGITASPRLADTR